MSGDLKEKSKLLGQEELSRGGTRRCKGPGAGQGGGPEAHPGGGAEGACQRVAGGQGDEASLVGCGENFGFYSEAGTMRKRCVRVHVRVRARVC